MNPHRIKIIFTAGGYVCGEVGGGGAGGVGRGGDGGYSSQKDKVRGVAFP